MRNVMVKVTTLAVLGLVAAGCTSAAVVDPGDGGLYAPAVDPARFVGVIDNPYLPLTTGSRWVYEGESDGEVERIEVTVLDDRRPVMGIDAVMVRDVVSVAGEIVEDTLDWFAQDIDGNVWYLGEEVQDFEGGRLVGTAGSWEAGVDGALPGIVMPAAPERVTPTGRSSTPVKPKTCSRSCRSPRSAPYLSANTRAWWSPKIGTRSNPVSSSTSTTPRVWV